MNNGILKMKSTGPENMSKLLDFVGEPRALLDIESTSLTCCSSEAENLMISSR